MASGFECAGQEGIEDGEGHVLADETGAQAENVGVVVGARQAGRYGFGNEGGPDARIPVGSDGHADAGTADEDAAVNVIIGEHAGNLAREDGVVTAIWAVAPDIDDLVTGYPGTVSERLLEAESGMVASECEAHEPSET